MKHLKSLPIILCGALLSGLMALQGCNSSDSTSFSYTNPSNLAVTEFKIKYNSDVSGVDSVFFSIDLDHKVIFNADSLPKGTSIDKLVPTISYGSDINKAIITMSGGKTREGEVDYLETPTDSIDFTGNVTLTLGITGADIETTYRVKVNVHNEVPDSLVWSETAYTTLPSRKPNPQACKTVTFGEHAVALIRENDGSYTIAESTDLYANNWTKQEVSFPFAPEVESFTGSDTGIWLLSTDGSLYVSYDYSTWTDTGEDWTYIIGSYLDSVVGLRTDGQDHIFTQYPMVDLVEKTAPADFPVEGGSNFVILRNKWTSSPVAFFTGGIAADGSVSDVTWAFDGAEWIRLSRGGVPPLEGASIVPYYHYRKSSTSSTMIEYSVWLLVGGRMADGNFNRTVYISYDNGVNWATGSESMQLPNEIPAMAFCDNVVMGTDKSSNLSDAWTRTRSPLPSTRMDYSVDGDIITWECPYIYLIGGYSTDGSLYNTIWQGVLSRLTFTPVI